MLKICMVSPNYRHVHGLQGIDQDTGFYVRTVAYFVEQESKFPIWFNAAPCWGNAPWL